MKITLNELRRLVKQVLKENKLPEDIQKVKDLFLSGEFELGEVMIQHIEPSISEEQFFEITFGEFQNFASLSGLKDVVHTLTQYGYIDFGQYGIKKIPESIAQFKQIETLILDSNYLTELPESIGQLENLGRLDLENNELTHLPESIGQLQNLKRLYLNGNHLTFLPESIGQLQSLMLLGLNNNELTHLPGSIENLQNLKILRLGNNKKLSKRTILTLERMLPNCKIYSDYR